MMLRCLILAMLIGIASPAARGSAAVYSIVDLGALAGFSTRTVPVAINNSGQVVGTAYSGPDGSTPTHAFLYSNGSIHDLQTLGGTTSAALGINQAGQVTGHSYLADSGGHPGLLQAFLYDGGSMQGLGSLVSGGSSNGSGINNLGQIVGNSAAMFNNQPAKDVFLYSGGVMNDLGNLNSPGQFPTSPLGINDSGQITGIFYQADGHVRAFLYTGGVLQNLGTLGGSTSYGSALNNSGWVVGGSDVGGGISHAFLFNGTIHDMGSAWAGNSYAGGINTVGEVVGAFDIAGTSHAFLAGSTPPLDLNSLIDPASGWILNSANAINDLGQITGTGTFAGQSRAYLLTPVPEPGALALATLGLFGLSASRVRLAVAVRSRRAFGARRRLAARSAPPERR